MIFIRLRKYFCYFSLMLVKKKKLVWKRTLSGFICADYVSYKLIILFDFEAKTEDLFYLISSTCHTIILFLSFHFILIISPSCYYYLRVSINFINWISLLRPAHLFVPSIAFSFAFEFNGRMIQLSLNSRSWVGSRSIF